MDVESEKNCRTDHLKIQIIPDDPDFFQNVGRIYFGWLKRMKSVHSNIFWFNQFDQCRNCRFSTETLFITHILFILCFISHFLTKGFSKNKGNLEKKQNLQKDLIPNPHNWIKKYSKVDMIKIQLSWTYQKIEFLIFYWFFVI